MARPAAQSEGDVSRPVSTGAGTRSPFDFVGRMTAVVAILPVSHEAAQAMLPAGLHLAVQEFTPGERHPLVLIMGQQSGVRPSLLPLGARYLEFILVLPFVEHRGYGPRGPFCYCPRLFLDRHLPTLAGRLLYGYDKRLAAIRMTEHSYRIADPRRGELLLQAEFQTTGAAVEPSRSGVMSLFQLPVISEAARGWRYSCADFGLDRALIQPVELHLEILRPFVSGLPLGAFTMSGAGGEASRAFRIRTSWRLAGPWALRSPPRRAGLDNDARKR
jgi:Acetoacetate decarboxylase (ADC)